jgi:hypothetical protein
VAHQRIDLIGWSVWESPQRRQFGNVTALLFILRRVTDRSGQSQHAVGVLNRIASWQLAQRGVGGLDLLRGRVSVELEIQVRLPVWHEARSDNQPEFQSVLDVWQMPEEDSELLSFSVYDILKRVRALRAEMRSPESAKAPVLTLVRSRSDLSA